VSLKELPLPSIASLRAIAALKNTHLALVRPARIGLGFESGGGNQKTLAEIEQALGGPGQISLPYSLRWLLDVMSGLAVLHRTLGFVHGEVQPEHVALGDDGIGRLIPVVRAHWVRGEQRAPERLYYLSPEKLLGDHVDGRSDVFSVGVMLWEAITGQRLLEAYTAESVVSRLMSGAIPRARAPEGEAWTTPLALVAERAIAVDPGRRFATIVEMKEAIEGPSLRYLASTPGMVALFQHPEQRLRGRVRDSVAPQSQRVTLLPADSEAALESPAGRLARPNLASVDLEEELTRPKGVTVPPPTARKVNHVDTLVGVPPPSVERELSPPDELTTPFVRVDSSRPAPAAKPPRSAPITSKVVPDQEAKTVVQPLSKLLNELEPPTTIMRSPVPHHQPTPPYFRSPVSTPPPPAPKPELRNTQPLAPTRVTPIPPRPSAVPPPSAPPPTFVDPRKTLPLSTPPMAPAHRPAERRITASGFPPMVASAPPPPPHLPVAPRIVVPAAPARIAALDDSFEQLRPRKRRGGLWLLLGAAVAVGLFAARPWLARQIAGTDVGAATDPTGRKLDTAQLGATPPLSPSSVDPPAAAPSVDAPALRIASAPASPAPSAAPRAVGRRRERVVTRETVDPSLDQPPPPAAEPEPEPAATSEPVAAPPPEEPPPPPPPPPKPVSDADRYGI
jgi:hypothetical protein